MSAGSFPAVLRQLDLFARIEFGVSMSLQLRLGAGPIYLSFFGHSLEQLISPWFIPHLSFGAESGRILWSP